MCFFPWPLEIVVVEDPSPRKDIQTTAMVDAVKNRRPFRCATFSCSRMSQGLKAATKETGKCQEHNHTPDPTSIPRVQVFFQEFGWDSFSPQLIHMHENHRVPSFEAGFFRITLGSLPQLRLSSRAQDSRNKMKERTKFTDSHLKTGRTTDAYKTGVVSFRLKLILWTKGPT